MVSFVNKILQPIGLHSSIKSFSFTVTSIVHMVVFSPCWELIRSEFNVLHILWLFTNNGGRGFGCAAGRLLPEIPVLGKFCTSNTFCFIATGMSYHLLVIGYLSSL